MAFFNKKSFTNHISDTINVGFHPYGPTLTSGGLLSTEKKVFLVDHISISLKTPFQPIRKEFNWFTMHPHAAVEGQFSIVKTPSKFVLSPGDPYKYSIMFVDNNCYAEMKTVMLNILSSWKGLKENSPEQPTAELFNSFQNMPMSKGLEEMLQSLCYWQTGKYHVDICITTKDDTVITSKSFELNGEDIDILKSNSPSIIAAACGQLTADYTIAKVALI